MVIDMTIDETIAKEKANAEKLRKIIETGYDGEISIEALFCDDTDAIKEVYERFENCAKEHEQRAEWLEELKEMRKNQGQVADFWHQEGIIIASKLIFNEIEEIKNRYDNEDFAIIGILIKIQEIALKTAEQLKAGGKE